jgi:hypothetical protein
LGTVATIIAANADRGGERVAGEAADLKVGSTESTSEKAREMRR